MKSAIIISGQPRNVLENYNSILKNILIPNNFPDVFIHSWISDDIYGKQFYSSWVTYNALNEAHKRAFEKYKDLPTIPTSEPIPSNVKDIISELYNPKKYLFEPQKEFTFDSKYYDLIKISKESLDTRLPNTLSLYYSTYAANVLKQSYEVENNFTYDYVMKIRFDLILKNPIVFTDYDPKVITYSDHHWKHEICFTNLWALTNSKNMNVYAQTYLNVLDIIDSNTIAFTDECILGKHIYDNNIQKNPIRFPTYMFRIKGVEF